MNKTKIKIHQLKTWPQYFTDISLGKKKFELRKNDRDFKVGDALCLEEFNPETGKYTLNYQMRPITYILEGFAGLEPGYVIMGLGEEFGPPIRKQIEADKLAITKREEAERKMTMENFAAQFTDSNFIKHEVFGKSVLQLKRKLSKLDVIGSATIWNTDDKDFAIIYYKPRWWKKKL